MESSRKSDHCDDLNDDDANCDDNGDHDIRDIVGKLNRVSDSKVMMRTLMMTMQGESRGGKAKEASTEEGEEGVRTNPRIDSTK